MSGRNLNLFQDDNRGRFGDNEYAPDVRDDAEESEEAETLTGEFVYCDERPAALAVRDRKKPSGPWVWLPKSKIEWAHASGGNVEIKIPMWLAKQKGLV